MTTLSSSSPRAFLLIGLAFSEIPKIHTDPAKAEQLSAMIRAGLNKTSDEFSAAGLEFKLVHCGPDEGMEECRAALEGRKWDGVLIGAGLRTTPQYTLLFEQLVNAAKDLAPQAKIIFNTTPHDSLEAARRAFPGV